MIYYIKIENSELIKLAESSFKSIYLEPYTQNLLLNCIEEIEKNENYDVVIMDQKGHKLDIESFIEIIEGYDHKFI